MGCDSEISPSMEPEETIPENVYQELLGKWSLYRGCGGVVGCWDIENIYHEYTPKWLIAYEKRDGMEAILTKKEIIKWDITETGCKILMRENDSINFTIKNDTLYAEKFMSSWSAVRIQ